MILFDIIKYFNELDTTIKFNRKFQFQNLEAILSTVSIDVYIPTLRNTLFEYGFKEVVQLEVGNWKARNNNFFFMKEKGINFIGFWNFFENGNIPIIFDIDDIDNDLDYLVLKYGKILQKQVEIS